jgi:hypothetical protein
VKKFAWRLVLVATVACAGCGHVAKGRERVQRELEAHSRALTTAVVDTLQLQPRRDDYGRLALELARENQRIEGLPAKSLPVTEWVGRTNLAEEFESLGRLLERRRKSEELLIDYGVRFEDARNTRRATWTKWAGSSLLAIGGGIALCVFFPLFIPIAGRVLAWVVGKVPWLANAAGVVSVKAFDAVVRGIEKAREGGTERFHNGPEPSAGNLDSRLSREMDREHKALVRARKAALKL